jgi:hypothetical protein
MKFDKWSGILFWFIFALLVLFPAFILWAIVHEHRRVPEVAKAFSVEVGDLRAFLKATDYGLHDFETSRRDYWEENRIGLYPDRDTNAMNVCPHCMGVIMGMLVMLVGILKYVFRRR